MLALWWGHGRANAGRPASRLSAWVSRLRGARNAVEQPSHHDETRAIADDLCARLDERAARLESLLGEAKETIARLEALRAEPLPAPARPSRARAKAAPSEEPPVVEVVPVRTAPADPLCERVYALADAGADAVAIAKSLDEQVGKVQLILALRN